MDTRRIRKKNRHMLMACCVTFQNLPDSARHVYVPENNKFVGAAAALHIHQLKCSVMQCYSNSLKQPAQLCNVTPETSAATEHIEHNIASDRTLKRNHPCLPDPHLRPFRAPHPSFTTRRTICLYRAHSIIKQQPWQHLPCSTAKCSTQLMPTRCAGR
jgi:hypothetical protein